MIKYLVVDTAVEESDVRLAFVQSIDRGDVFDDLVDADIWRHARIDRYLELAKRKYRTLGWKQYCEAFERYQVREVHSKATTLEGLRWAVLTKEEGGK